VIVDHLLVKTTIRFFRCGVWVRKSGRMRVGMPLLSGNARAGENSGISPWGEGLAERGNVMRILAVSMLVFPSSPQRK
jgi:hypothetical protein